LASFSLAAARAEKCARIDLRDGLVWADVDCTSMTGQTTLHFVVDTGAASSCVNLAAAKRLGLRMGGAVDVAGVGGMATGYRCGDFDGTVGGMPLPGNVLALDLSGPARGCSRMIDGLIGADFFRGHVVQIDYARGVMSGGAALALKRGMPGRFANNVICVPVAVNGGPARWTRLDTGCTDALDWCEGAGPRAKAAHSVALASSCRGAVLADVTVGDAHLHGLPVKLHARQIFPGEAGLLGNAALSRYTVTIDGIDGRVELTPRP
jgi:hypothetical protein